VLLTRRATSLRSLARAVPVLIGCAVLALSSLAVRADIAALRQDNALVRKDMQILSSTMTIRLGSMLMFGLGLLFAALKLT